jgi:putative ubiquitin-RnfH superfamily antitoxin RatB of RatAB toxin-antitoxin module
MQRFILRENIELYRRLLADPHDHDEVRLQTIMKLLADEEATERRLLRK